MDRQALLYPDTNEPRRLGELLAELVRIRDLVDLVPFLYLAECDIPEWPPTSCRLCATGVPINVE